MSASYKFMQTLRKGETPISREVVVTSDGAWEADVTVANSVTDQLTAATIAVADIASLWIVSSRDVTLETGDGATPDDTISLVAGVPLVWDGYYYACPFTVDIDGIYLTNASGQQATVIIRFGINP